MKPAPQLQLYETILSTQVPPFKQGLGEHMLGMPDAEEMTFGRVTAQTYHNYFIIVNNNNNNNFLCANILENQAQWRDKTKELSTCVNVEQCVSR